MYRVLLYSVLLFVSIKTFSQTPVYYQLTEKDGLPDIEFYDIAEDNQGFIWLAADKGLYRYDGKTFKNYTHPEKKGLSVFGLKFDDENRLWCNNISGQFFYVENDSLKFFTDLANKNKGQLAPFFIKKNKIYAHVVNLGFKIDLETRKTTTVVSNSSSYKAYFSHNDSLFYSQGKSIYVKKNESYTAIDTIKFTKGYVAAELIAKNLGKNNDILLQAVDRNNKIERFFLRRNFKFKELSTEELNLDTAINKSFVENNKVWFATAEGAYEYVYEHGKFVMKRHIFKDKIITSILKDKNGNYWFTTFRNGVFIVPNINLLHFRNSSVQHISSLEKISDTSFIYGTAKGKLIKYNLQTNRFVKLPLLLNEKVNEIAYNQHDKFVVSYVGKGYLFEKGVPSEISDFPIGFGGAKEISFFNKEKLIYGAFAYATIVDLKSKGTHRIGFRRSYTTHYNKNNKTIYVGYVDGVEFYKNDLVPHPILFQGKPIFALDIDNTKDSTTWIATFSNGIIGVKEGKVVENYTTEKGLLSNQTRVVKGDGDNLWIVTDKGIQCLNTKLKAFKSITKKDGLSSFNVCDIITYEDRIYFGTNKGLYQLNKNKGFKKNDLSNFYFTKVLIEDEEVKIEESYDLSSNVNKVQFQFHSNGFLEEENSKYSYRLLGASDEWTNVPDRSNQITFNSLSAGNYTFQIKKTTSTNSSETGIKSVKIKIRNPFYKEWWFMLFITLLVIVTIAFYYSKKLKEKEKEKELVFLKLENLRSQMNPHFVFNALNSIQDYILLNKKNVAGDYLGKFADLMRMYLYHSTKAFISLEEEIEALEQYLELEKLRFEDSFEYIVIYKGIKDLSFIEIPTMLIQPYVENSIKHGLLHRKTNRDLKVEFLLKNELNYLTCIITDNGIGRKKSADLNKNRRLNHQSFATKANQDRLDLLNYGRKEKIGVEIIDLYTENKEPKGTQVVLKIPYKIV